MFCLFFVLCILGLVTAGQNPHYRMIAGFGNKKYAGNIPPVNIFTLLDPDRSKMRSLPFYNNESIAAQKIEALQWFNDTYGLDYTKGIPNPVYGGYILPQGLLVQYCIIPDLEARKVQYDSLYPNRIGKWSGFFEAGYIFQATTPGTYGGERSQYVNYARFSGDIIVFADYTWVDPDKDWSDPNNRETVKARTIHPRAQQLNGAGVPDTLSHVLLIDKDGREGLFIDGTFRTLLLNGTWMYNVGSTMTWQ